MLQVVMEDVDVNYGVSYIKSGNYHLYFVTLVFLHSFFLQ